MCREVRLSCQEIVEVKKVKEVQETTCRRRFREFRFGWQQFEQWSKEFKPNKLIAGIRKYVVKIL